VSGGVCDYQEGKGGKGVRKKGKKRKVGGGSTKMNVNVNGKVKEQLRQ
jgi:hypothetical protein